MPLPNDMKSFRFASLASRACTAIVTKRSFVTAIAIAPVVLQAARPHYGGTLRIETQGVIRTFDPAAVSADAAESAARARVLPLVFETLVAGDSSGRLQPLVANAWERDASGRRWRFRIRTVTLHDGSRLQPAHVAAVLRAREPAWKVGADGETVVIDLDRAQPDFLWDVADARHAIAVRTASGDLVGSGPFRLESAAARRHTLRAHEQYWGGRPFLDTVQIAEGRAPGDQLAALELGRADFVAVRPIDLRRLLQRGFRSASSRPIEVVALVFEPHRANPADEVVRRAVAAAIDRTTLSTVLLQRQGEPAAALLPQWLSGYAPMFQSAAAPPRAAIAALPLERRRLTLRVDAADGVLQAIAERIAVDAREAGVTIDVQAPVGLAPRPDVRLVRLPCAATTPDRALAALMAGLGPRITSLMAVETAPVIGAPIETVYRVEQALVERHVIVPVVHLPAVYGFGERVESWNGQVVSPSDAWNLANVWLRNEPPGKPGGP